MVNISQILKDIHHKKKGSTFFQSQPSTQDIRLLILTKMCFDTSCRLLKGVRGAIVHAQIHAFLVQVSTVQSTLLSLYIG